MKFPRNLLSVALSCMAGLCIRCSFGPLAGGSEIGNPTNAVIIGYAVYANTGNPAAGARVTVCHERFLKDTSVTVNGSDSPTVRETVTDEAGFFSVDRLNPGVFHIEINDGQSWGSFSSCQVSAHDTGVATTAGLKPTGRISGTLGVPAGYRGTAYVQVFGLNRIARATPGGAFTLSEIPEGGYVLHVLPPRNEYVPKDIGTVAVASGAETDLRSVPVQFNGSAWKFKRRIVLNTTASGANIADDIVGFPVLVRLNSALFNFAEARSTGADLRFAKPDGVPLAYEIERWEPAAGHAEVWVRTDTIHGNDSQSLVMFWGNGEAEAQSNGRAVFDTAAGFAGVWHFNEAGDSVHDATSNAFGGVNSGADPGAGIIGNARTFASGNYVKISGLLRTPAGLTLSAWARATSSGGGQEVVSIGDAALIRLDDSRGIGTSGWYHNSALIDTGFAIAKSERYVANTGWHLISYTVDPARNVQTLYIDGVACASSTDAYPINYQGVGTDTYIGIHGNGKAFFDFSGEIDEVRVNSIPLDSNWIRLCHMNQKEQDALVEFK